MSQMQTYRELPPSPRLESLVSCLWVQRVPSSSPPFTHRTVPTGSVEIQVTLGSAPTVVGPQLEPIVATKAPGSITFGVRLRPGRARRVLDLPTSELTGRQIGLDEVWGRAAATLAERLAGAASDTSALAILEDAVGSRDSNATDPVLNAAIGMVEPWQGRGVAQVAGMLDLSPRLLHRRFASAVGYGPKALQGVLRFQGFLALAGTAEGRRLGLGHLAADAGYSDQPHLSRHALRLAGLSPARLLAETAESCDANHDHAPTRTALLRFRYRRDPEPRV